MSLIALVDCNNFFVSCERVFQPELMGVPVVVLSSNDGCVVARSNEVKELGIPMGAPYFQFRKLFEEHGVRVFSSNYALYADMSQRVMSVLGSFTDSMQVYSVDEAFLEIGPEEPEALALAVRETVWRNLGIPVSVGIAETKTRAKIASRVAKKGAGVFDIETHPDPDSILDSMTPGEVWGVGPATARLLQSGGVRTALGLKNAPDEWMRKKAGITGLRTVHELRGIRVFDVAAEGEPKQSIRRSRSFGRPVTNLEELEHAVAVHADHAARELRGEGSAAREVSVFIGTSRHRQNDPSYSNSAGEKLRFASSDSREIISAARRALSRIWKPGFLYSRAGVVLSDIIPEELAPRATLFEDTGFDENREVMRIMDVLNAKYGERALRPASAYSVEAEEGYAPKHRFRSRPYTTSWSDILKVRV